MSGLNIEEFYGRWVRPADERIPVLGDIYTTEQGTLCMDTREDKLPTKPMMVHETVTVANWPRPTVWQELTLEERNAVNESDEQWMLRDVDYVEVTGNVQEISWRVYVGITPQKPKAVELIDDPSWKNPADTPGTQALREIATVLGVHDTPFHILRRIEELKTWDPPYDGDTL